MGAAGALFGGSTNRPGVQQAFPADLAQFRAGSLGQAQNWQSMLGQLGMGQATDLQRLSGGNYLQQYMQANPEQQALDMSMPALQAMLQQQNPGGDVVNPLRDIATRNLEDSLNQMRSGVPNRMSSAALWQEGATRQRSAQDFNLLAQQAMEQGRARQIQAAQMLGMLSGQAGQNPFSRAQGVAQLGLQQNQNQFNALQSLLGPMNQAAFGGPMMQDPSQFQNYLSALQTSGDIPQGTGNPLAWLTHAAGDVAGTVGHGASGIWNILRGMGNRPDPRIVNWDRGYGATDVRQRRQGGGV